jgi:hypothetical protein
MPSRTASIGGQSAKLRAWQRPRDTADSARLSTIRTWHGYLKDGRT